MGWVWSDELAESLRESPEIAPLIPPTWTSQPAAYAVVGDERSEDAGRRLLGLSSQPATGEAPRVTECTCGREASTA